MNSSDMGRDVHSLTLSIQQFLYDHGVAHPPGCRRMVLERLSCSVTCPVHVGFRLLAVARRGSCGPTRALILIRTKSLASCSKKEMRRSVLWHLYLAVITKSMKIHIYCTLCYQCDSVQTHVQCTFTYHLNSVQAHVQCTLTYQSDCV